MSLITKLAAVGILGVVAGLLLPPRTGARTPTPGRAWQRPGT